MNLELSTQEIELIRESLTYSQQRIADEPQTPYEIRQRKLEQIQIVAQKLPRVATAIRS